jgi:signal transduction histidine kinase
VLTNIQRHAGARRICLETATQDQDLVIDISDDGRGMRVPSQPTSFGLLGMHERARAIGGDLSIRSTIGHGTLVSLRLRGVLA